MIYHVQCPVIGPDTPVECIEENGTHTDKVTVHAEGCFCTFTPVVCKGCGKAILDGDACYTGREPEEHWHWDCHKKVRDQYESTRNEIPAVLERVDVSLARLRKLLGK